MAGFGFAKISFLHHKAPTQRHLQDSCAAPRDSELDDSRLSGCTAQAQFTSPRFMTGKSRKVRESGIRLSRRAFLCILGPTRQEGHKCRRAIETIVWKSSFWRSLFPLPREPISPAT